MHQSITHEELNSSSSNVIIVDIDEKSLSMLGQWPWPRIVLAELINAINLHKPSAIGLDIIFPEEDRTSPKQIAKFYKNFFKIDGVMDTLPKQLLDNDLILLDSLERSASVMSLYLSQDNVSQNQCLNIHSVDDALKSYELNISPYILCNTFVLNDTKLYSGFINVQIDKDGVLRRMPLFRAYADKAIPTFSMATLMSIDGGIYIDKDINLLDHTILTNTKSEVLLNFYNDKWYKKVSAIDILNNTVDQNSLIGKIVLLGSSATALHDQMLIAGGKKIIGVKVHATLIDNILQDDTLVQPFVYQKINIIISLLLTFLLFYLLVTKYNSLILFLTIGIISTSAVITYFMLENGVYISIGYLLVPFFIHFFLISILYIIIDTYERRVFSEELNRSHVALLDSMVHVAEVHDIETGMHIIRTKKYIKLLGEYIYSKGIYKDEITKETIELMYRTAPLHDLGKVGIEDAILKKPGKLTEDERITMKKHSELGKDIINNAIISYQANEFFIMARNIAHYHHEKWDGTGYPEGLVGSEIPIESRFMALADVYDALVSKRVYKESFSYEKTISIIKKGRGSFFDPILVDAFLEIQDQFREIADTYKDNHEELM